MFYRVRANLIFTEPDEGKDFYHDCEVALPKSLTVNTDAPYNEHSTILIEKCFHDEDPPMPCTIINSAETP